MSQVNIDEYNHEDKKSFKILFKILKMTEDDIKKLRSKIMIEAKQTPIKVAKNKEYLRV